MEKTATGLSPLQTQIRALYTKVQEQKLALENAAKGTYCTDGMFKFGSNTPEINIKTVRQVDKLVEMLSFMIDKNKSNDKACDILGVTSTEFTWCGASIENWIVDFKTRIAQINTVDQKQKLAKAEAQLETFKNQDPEFFASIELEKISQLLG